MIGRSLNADLRKMKGTSVILAHLLIPIITSVIFLIYYFFSPWNENMKVIAFYQAIGAGLPVLIGIFTASVMEQLYLWQLILAFQFGKGVSIGAGIISGLISALMLTGLGDYVWKYVFVCWTGRVPYTYLQSVLGETSVGEWLSFIPGCLIFTGISMVYYFWWVNHWEGNRISE